MGGLRGKHDCESSQGNGRCHHHKRWQQQSGATSGPSLYDLHCTFLCGRSWSNGQMIVGNLNRANYIIDGTAGKGEFGRKIEQFANVRKPPENTGGKTTLLPAPRRATVTSTTRSEWPVHRRTATGSAAALGRDTAHRVLPQVAETDRDPASRWASAAVVEAARLQSTVAAQIQARIDQRPCLWHDPAHVQDWRFLQTRAGFHAHAATL